MNECLRVENVRKTFPAGRGRPAVTAVDGISFSLSKGESLGVIGPSGCGKTTLTRLILGLEKPDYGLIKVNGKIGFVPQDPYASLDPKLTIFQCVAEPLIFLHRKRTWKECTGTVRDVMMQVYLDYDTYASRFPSQLSGGERQRAAIARALVHDPDLLILDEPTSMIDQAVRQEITILLTNLSKHRARSFLMVTHDIAVSVAICDRLIVMEDGHVVETDTTAEVIAHPKAELTQRLMLVSQDIKRYWDEMPSEKNWGFICIDEGIGCR